MSMPNRFCVIERRLDIIEIKLGIDNSSADLNRSVGSMKDEVERRGKTKMLKKDWKYYECPNCFVLFPHLVVPDICGCGNDMRKYHNKKTLKLIEFAKSEEKQ